MTKNMLERELEISEVLIMSDELKIYNGIKDLKIKNVITGATITVWDNSKQGYSNPDKSCGLTINFAYADNAKKLEIPEIISNFGLESENTTIDTVNGTFSTIISSAYKSQIEANLKEKMQNGTRYTVEKPWDDRYVITFSKK